YKVELTEYFPYAQNVTDEEWDNAIINLNTRIISGDMPDILDMSHLSVQIYQSKGLLEDLYPYMEHDPEIRKEDYFENVFEAISLDGKLPYLTDGAAISTMLAVKILWLKTMAGPFRSWKRSLILRSQFHKQSVWCFLPENHASDRWQFIDWNLGKCSFDSPEFVKCWNLPAKYRKAARTALEERR
ncbi:MAG: hypothetical protein ACLRJU_25180, partial [Enterocloster sp.]